jgi:DNA-3-methyladenine glycosylase II
MPSFTLAPRGPFSLQLLAGFGFGPETGRSEATEPVMRLAFCLDDLRGHAGVVLRQDSDGDGAVRGELHWDADPAAVARQVARILSLDHDGEAWVAIGERDPVIGKLQRRYPGLRPPLFHSPYEAAAWAIISTRRPARQAAVTRRLISERLGRAFEFDGEHLAAFPTPRALLELEPLKGLPQVKVERLHAVAEAALAGRLDADRLRSLEPEAALADLQELPGIGPFYSTLVLVRSSGHADLPPASERRMLAAAANYYGLDQPPTPERFAELAEAWRPFRTWASVLLRYAGSRDDVVEAVNSR